MLKTDSVSATQLRRNSDVRSCPTSSFPQRNRFNRPSGQFEPAKGASCGAGVLTRRLIVAFVLAVALASALTFTARPADAAAAPRLDKTERKVVKLINSFRARHGRPRLRASGRLNRVADRHSRAMLAHDFFAHSSRNGTAATTRVRRSSRARSVGENIAFVGVGGGRTAKRVVDMWIRSPGHRAVMLNRSFRRIGVGRRGGRLGSSRGNAFTADFASRR